MHPVDLPEWVAQRRKMLPAIHDVEPRSTALLVIDLQRYFVDPGHPVTVPNAIEVVPHVNRLARVLRERGGQVVWLRHTFRDTKPFAVPAWYAGPDSAYVQVSRENLRPGAANHELHASLDTTASDWIVDKHRFSPFLSNSSNLDEQLRTRGIDTLIISGTLTNCCCECSARDAVMLDYRVLFAADATAALTDAEHQASLMNLALTFVDVRPTAGILDLIEGRHRR